MTGSKAALLKYLQGHPQKFHHAVDLSDTGLGKRATVHHWLRLLEKEGHLERRQDNDRGYPRVSFRVKALPSPSPDPVVGDSAC